MQCLYCGKRLALFRKLTDGEFCCARHRQRYQEEQDKMAMARLLEQQQRFNRAAPRRSLTAEARKAREKEAAGQVVPPVAAFLVEDVTGRCGRPSLLWDQEDFAQWPIVPVLSVQNLDLARRPAWKAEPASTAQALQAPCPAARTLAAGGADAPLPATPGLARPTQRRAQSLPPPLAMAPAVPLAASFAPYRISPDAVAGSASEGIAVQPGAGLPGRLLARFRGGLSPAGPQAVESVSIVECSPAPEVCAAGPIQERAPKPLFARCGEVLSPTGFDPAPSQKSELEAPPAMAGAIPLAGGFDLRPAGANPSAWQPGCHDLPAGVPSRPSLGASLGSLRTTGFETRPMAATGVEAPPAMAGKVPLSSRIAPPATSLAGPALCLLDEHIGQRADHPRWLRLHPDRVMAVAGTGRLDWISAADSRTAAVQQKATPVSCLQAPLVPPARDCWRPMLFRAGFRVGFEPVDRGSVPVLPPECNALDPDPLAWPPADGAGFPKLAGRPAMAGLAGVKLRTLELGLTVSKPTALLGAAALPPPPGFICPSKLLKPVCEGASEPASAAEAGFTIYELVPAGRIPWVSQGQDFAVAAPLAALPDAAQGPCWGRTPEVCPVLPLPTPSHQVESPAVPRQEAQPLEAPAPLPAFPTQRPSQKMAVASRMMGLPLEERPCECAATGPKAHEALMRPSPPMLRPAGLETAAEWLIYDSGASSLVAKLSPAYFWKTAPRDLKWATLALPVVLVVALVTLSAPRSNPDSAGGPGAEGVQGLMQGRLEFVRQAIAGRAAINFQDDFRSGLSDWEGRGNWTKEWVYDPAGFVEAGALALYKPSIPLVDYHLEFHGQIERKALSWVVRAADLDNYYVMKIQIVKPGPLPTAAIVRYPVIQGKEGPRVQTPLPLTIRADTVYKVHMEVSGSNFTTSLHGQVVDFWSDSRLKSGGVGFFSAKGEKARLRWVEVSHQYDALGRLCAYLAPYDLHSAQRSWQQ